MQPDVTVILMRQVIPRHQLLATTRLMGGLVLPRRTICHLLPHLGHGMSVTVGSTEVGQLGGRLPEGIPIRRATNTTRLVILRTEVRSNAEFLSVKVNMANRHTWRNRPAIPTTIHIIRVPGDQLICWTNRTALGLAYLGESLEAVRLLLVWQHNTVAAL